MASRIVKRFGHVPSAENKFFLYIFNHFAKKYDSFKILQF
jgi:hypothetical protein